MNYSELLQLAKGWGNFISDRIIIWRLRLSTETRQKEIVELAQSYDMVLLIGSMRSNNTRNLYRISKKINDMSFLVQDSEHLPIEIEQVNSIAVASGASTPYSLIQRIIEKISKQESAN